MNIVDRRPNPKGKSLSNRQRFLSRARAEVKSAVQNALRKRKVADVEHGEKVAIPMRGIVEPVFHHSRRTGRNEHVVPGNKEYVRGDEIPRPTGGDGRGGSQGSPDGSGEDAFEFTLSKDEFLDMFFEDLELPDLVKKSLRETFAVDLQRAGYTVTGSPANLSIRRTMRNSMARRISLRRPKTWQVEALREAVAEASARGDEEEVRKLTLELDRAEHRSKIIPYIDPLDVRYNRFERVPRPNTEAVMFCLMDVSGSMTEAMKDLAKRFFMLLHVFLIRRYRHVDVVFIRHTSTRGRGRRGDVLLQPRDRRHRGFDSARKDAGDRPGALSDGPLEHLRRTSLRRRQLRRGQRSLRLSAGRRSAAIVPVFRLYRGRRRDGRQPDRPRPRQRSVARL